MADVARTAAADPAPATTADPTYTDEVTVTSRPRRRRLGQRASTSRPLPPDPEAEAIRAAMLELAKL